MDSADLLRFLDAQAVRLHKVAARNLAASVPTCPGWTVEDLVLHVANGYLNVVVPQLRLPEQVLAQDLSGLEPLTALQHSHATLASEFAARRRRDQERQEAGDTASFWIRRMAHETAIHRIDAELAQGEPSARIPPALAADGIDEFLTVVLTHETQQWMHQYANDLSDWGQRWLMVSAGSAQWHISVRPQGVDAAIEAPAPVAGRTPAASIRGDADPLLRWIYNRDRAQQVIITGDVGMTAQFRRLLTAIVSLS